MARGIDPVPWLLVMALPPILLALLFPPSIYRTAFIVCAINILLARYLWAQPRFSSNALDWRTFSSLITVVTILELIGLLSRRQRQLVQSLAQTESELRQQKSFLQRVLDSCPNLISVCDPEETLVLVNSAVAKLLGKPIEEITGKRAEELQLHQKFIRHNVHENLPIAETSPSYSVPIYSIIDSQGELRWYQISKRLLQDTEGQVEHTLLVGHEVTYQKLATDELVQNNKFFQALAKSTHHLLNNDFTEALQQAMRTLGEASKLDCIFVVENQGSGEAKTFQLAEDYIWRREGTTVGLNFTYPLIVPYFPTFTRLYGLLASGHTIDLEDLTDSERSQIYGDGVFSFIVMPIQVDGEFWGVVGFAGEMKRREWRKYELNTLATFSSILGGAIARRNDWKELERQEEFTTAVIRALPIDVFVKDKQGRFIMANHPGEASQEMVGKTTRDLFGDSEETQKYLEEDAFVFSSGQTYVSPIESYRTKRGEQKWRQVEKSPIRAPHGEITHLVGIQYDLTEQILHNEELRNSKEAAEAATRAKSTFLANMSHEIRTPMNAVIGMTDLLSETKLDSDQQEFVRAIRTSGQSLLSIINQILDFSKIEFNQLNLEILPFNLIECLAQTLDLFAHKAYEKGVELILSISPNVPVQIQGDSMRLRQILSNLIDNGIKFTEQGDVIISVSAVPGEPNSLHFVVRDTGIGIASEEQQRLFQSFTQVDASITRRFGGTGLGLAISKQLCELMNGRIWVESELTHGSAFHFTIAAEPVAEQSLWPENRNALLGKHILLVESHAQLQIELQGLLKLWGANVVLAPSIGKAVFSSNATFSYDLVIVELTETLPNEFRQLATEQNGSTTFDIPILLLATVGDKPNLSELQKLGKFAVLIKPIKPYELFSSIKECCARSTQALSAVNRRFPIATTFSEAKVLLVEDNEINRRVALRLLQRLGYQADIAGNGAEAVDLLLRRSYDVVLMDAHMPVMGGLEATRRIRSVLPSGVQPYIIGLTADAMTNFREECLAAGMNEYITKPVGLEVLAAAMERSTSQTEPDKVVA
ncbi:MAG: ATP-binding protein [Caldilineaceae bacterium]